MITSLGLIKLVNNCQAESRQTRPRGPGLYSSALIPGVLASVVQPFGLASQRAAWRAGIGSPGPKTNYSHVPHDLLQANNETQSRSHHRSTAQCSWQRSNTAAAAADEISLRSWEHLRHLVIWSDPAINLPSAGRRNRGNIPVAGIYPHRDIQAYTRQTQTDSDRHASARHWQSFGLFGQSTVVFHELFLLH